MDYFLPWYDFRETIRFPFTVSTESREFLLCLKGFIFPGNQVHTLILDENWRKSNFLKCNHWFWYKLIIRCTFLNIKNLACRNPSITTWIVNGLRGLSLFFLAPQSWRNINNTSSNLASCKFNKLGYFFYYIFKLLLCVIFHWEFGKVKRVYLS